MECTGHSLSTNTKPVEDDGFQSFEKARAALLKELMSQIKAARKQKGEACAKYKCAEGKRCATTISYSANAIDAAIQVDDDEDDEDEDPTYGYDWKGGQIHSACRCVRKKEKPKK